MSSIKYTSLTKIRFGTLNARGLQGKIDTIDRLITKYDLDFVFVTETWVDTRNRPFRGIVSQNPGTTNEKGRAHYGTCIMTSPSRKTRFNFEILREGEDGKLQVFRYGRILFIGCYIPPSNELDEHWCELITECINIKEANEPVVLLGDLNMRLGKLSGDKGSNPRAKTIYPLLREFNLDFARNPNLSPKSRMTYTQGIRASSIPDYIFYDTMRLSLHHYEVAQEDVGSDHLLIFAELGHNQVVEESRSYLTWNMSRLKDEKVAEGYSKHFLVNHLAQFNRCALEEPKCQKEVDEVYSRMMNLVNDSAEKCIGHTNRTKWQIPTLHPAIPEIREWCRILRQRLQVPNLNAQEDLLMLNKLRKLAAYLADKAMKANWHKFTEKTDNLDGSELTKVVYSFKAARTRKKANTLKTDDASMESYAAHYSKQFSPHSNIRPHARAELIPSVIDRAIYFHPPLVKQAIKAYPNGKSGGPSGLKMEIIKPLADMIAHPLARFFNRLVEIGLVPTEWCRAVIIPIPKKPGAKSISEHRPISLTEVMRKVFERCLRPALVMAIGYAHFAQGGFENGKGTLDQVASLNEAMLMYKAKGITPCVAFLDIKAAYDSTDRDVLCNRLTELGSPVRLTRIIMALFDNNESQVAVDGKLSPRVTHSAGLLQGSILSPTLYNCYIGGIQERLIAANEGNQITSFWYADDSAIVATSPAHLQRLLGVAEAHSDETNYKFNPAKCEVMNCSETVKLYGEPIPRCTQFKYLGVWFNEQGADWKLHCQKMSDKANTVVNFWRSVGFNPGGFGIRTRRFIYVCFIRPVLEYGLAILPELKIALKELQKAQGRALCAMYGTAPNASRAALETLTAVPEMPYRRLELRARWLNRIRSRGESQMTKVVQNIQMQRPRTKQSSFAEIEGNHILQYHDSKVEEERVNHITSGMTRRFRPRDIKVSIQEKRYEHLMSRREETSRCTHVPIYADCKARFIYAISRQPKEISKVILKWMIGHYPGAPRLCLACNREKAGSKHLIQCAGARDINWLIGKQKWRQAILEIVKVFEITREYGKLAIKLRNIDVDDEEQIAVIE